MRVLPPWENALDTAARRCAAILAERPLADLSDVLVLLPGMHAAAALRARIRTSSGLGAFIGPVCHTPATLAGTTAAARRVAEQRARVLLLDALRDHPGLTGDTDPWTLVEALLTLFGELGDQCAAAPGDADALAARLRTAYGGAVPERPLRREAALVSTLWQAWLDRGGSAMALGDGAAVVAALDRWRAVGGRELIVAGLDQVPPVLAPALARAAEEGWATLLYAGPPELLPASLAGAADPGPPPPDAVHALAAMVAPDGTDITTRARAIGDAWPEPPDAAAYSVAAADGPEHEARIVDVQLRGWWLTGLRRIALVTEDRKLARRVRALLARSGLALDDSSGWALSTTSAAAALERWLEAVEEDFRASPLLDLLKSPFCGIDDDRDAQLADVWQFEEGVVRREQTGRGLDPYRKAIRRRSERLPDQWGETVAGRLTALLDRIGHAAAPLLRHARQPARRYPAAELMAALHESLDRLGLRAGFAADTAGRRVLEELAAMTHAAADGPALGWHEWRTWVGRTLERAVFREQVGDSVHLLALSDCSAGEYDAVIVAGADAEHMPGRQNAHPFFNDRVRKELGLETWTRMRSLRAMRFRRALALAPRRVVTWSAEREQAEQLPSPWLAAIDAAHTLAWDRPVAVPGAVALARDARTLVTAHGDPLPGPSRRPAPPLDRVPARWSARAHQDLIDCPYRWFAAHRLQLDAPDPLREALSKQDFGVLVHRCLQAFHADVRDLPGPFGTTVTPHNRADAEALLREIGDAVLAEEAATDFIARAWLRAWRRAVPVLAEFEVERAAAGWRVEAVEHAFERSFGPVTLRGRIDRVEFNRGARAVLDYKTGGAPTNAAIATGENVQLTSYALGVEGVSELYFVALGDALKGRAVKAAGLPAARTPAPEVPDLVALTAERLDELAGMLARGAELPAWGDAASCRFCRYDGLCRRGTWHEGDDA